MCASVCASVCVGCMWFLPVSAEHLAAVEIMNLKNIIILQNKIDLVKEAEAAAQYEEIRNFIQGMHALAILSHCLGGLHIVTGF